MKMDGYVRPGKVGLPVNWLLRPECVVRPVPGNGRLRPAFEGEIGHVAAAHVQPGPGRSCDHGDSRRYGPFEKCTCIISRRSKSVAIKFLFLCQEIKNNRRPGEWPVSVTFNNRRTTASSSAHACIGVSDRRALTHIGFQRTYLVHIPMTARSVSFAAAIYNSSRGSDDPNSESEFPATNNRLFVVTICAATESICRFRRPRAGGKFVPAFYENAASLRPRPASRCCPAGLRTSREPSRPVR